MKKAFCFTYNYFLYKLFKRRYSDSSLVRGYLKHREYIPDRNNCTAEEINEIIAYKIESGVPFMAGRFGATELSCIKTFDFALKSKYRETMNQIEQWSGMFPPTNEMGKRFTELMISLIHEADVMGVWMLPFEDYYLKTYGSEKLETTYLLDLEPWSSPKIPWSTALKGKKVLVIHPFAETIQSQYKKRELIFPDTDILPEFELKTLKAVQTVAGEKDSRFATWFDALDWMYQEALKIDFDIAIIGCGAYGFPLAAKLKQAGKQAIHLAGATQLLFGIKGKRWEENDAFTYVQKFFNDSWVRPGEVDKPKNAKNVEDGCYW